MTTVLSPSTYRPTFEPIEMSGNVNTSSLEQAVDVVFDRAEAHVGLIIAHLQAGIEQHKDFEIQRALDENQVLKDQARTLTEFLKHLDGALSNPSAKRINLTEHSELVSHVNQLISHDLLTKTDWSRDEAEALSRIIPRRSEELMNQINDKMRGVHNLVEDRHELLTIFRELMKMLREMHEVFIRNQRV